MDVDRVEVGAVPFPGFTPDPRWKMRLLGLLTTNARRVIGPIRSEPMGVYGTTDAVRLTFVRDPPKREIVETTTHLANRIVLWRAVLVEVANGWLEPCIPEDVEVSGRVFMGPKDRLIYDPEVLNRSLAEIPISYPRATDLLTRGWTCAVKGDIKAAFKHVKVWQDHRRYLGVVLDGHHFRWTVLPFGMSQSPALFSMALAKALDPARAVTYVDDMAIGGAGPAEACENALHVMKAVHDAGWALAPEKWFLRPASILVFVGFRVNFVDGTVRVIREKAWKAAERLAEALHLGPKYRSSLRKSLGMVAWLSTAARMLALPRPRLDALAGRDTFVWTADARSDAELLISMLVGCNRWRHLQRPVQNGIFLATDASASGWGAFIRTDGQLLQVVGVLTEEEAAWPSVSREFLAIERALEALDRRGVRYDGVLVETDSRCAVQASLRKSLRSDWDAPFRRIMERVRNGLDIRLTWCPRSAPMQTHVDALSGKDFADWTLNRAVARWLWEWSGGWSIDLFASEDTALADKYGAAFANQADRERLLSGSALSCDGFQGPASVIPLNDERVYAYPPWSQVPMLASRFQESRDCVLVLITSTRRGSWWFPALTDLDVWQTQSARLEEVFPDSPVVRAPDGREVQIRGLEARVYIRGNPPPRPGRPRWWSNETLASCGDVEQNPGPAQSDGWLFATAKPMKGGKGKRRAKRNASKKSTNSTALTSPAPSLKRVGRQTIANWLQRMVAANHGQAEPVLGGESSFARGVNLAVQQTVGRESSTKARLTQALHRLQSLGEGLEEPNDEYHRQCVLLRYAAERLGGRRNGSWNEIRPTSLPSEISAIAAMSRDLGFDCPPYGGPMVKRYLKAKGAFEKRTVSNHLPIHLAKIASWRKGLPPRWRDVHDALIVQSIFMLRPGLLLQLAREMLIPVGKGFVLRWTLRTKARRGPIGSPGHVMLSPQVSAAEHPLLTAVMRRLPSTGPLFPAVTMARMTAFLEMKIPDVPQGFIRGPHGVRTATDTELKVLAAPPELIDLHGQWTRRSTRTSDYYGSESIPRMFAMTRLLGQTDFEYPVPGLHVAVKPIGFTFREPQDAATGEVPPLDGESIVDLIESEDEVPRETSAPHEDPTRCCRCHCVISEDTSSRCARGKCRWLRKLRVCRTCHPDASRPWWCVHHSEDGEAEGDADAIIKQMMRLPPPAPPVLEQEAAPPKRRRTSFGPYGPRKAG